MTENHEGDNKGTPAAPLGRAASYARRSVMKEEAVLQQHDTNANRAQADGFTVPPELRWGDDGVSGTTTERGGLGALLTLIKSGRAPFTRLYVRERDRLSRTGDPRFAPFIEYTCKLNGVTVCYASDAAHMAYDGTEADEMVRYIMASLENVQAHQEWRKIRERTTSGTRGALKRGKYVNGGPAPFGYEKWLVCDTTNAFAEKVRDGVSTRKVGHHFRLRVNPDERVVVEQIFEGIRARKSYADIARALHASGAPRCGRKPWSADAVRKVARNPLHKGDYVHGRLRHRGEPMPAAELDPSRPPGRPVVLTGFVDDPVVTPATWDSAQEIMDARMAPETMRKAASARFLLTGVIRCATCGDALYGHRQPERRGQREHMYRHTQERRRSQRGQAPCPHANRYIAAAPIEAVALEATNQLLDGDAAERLAQQELARLRANVSGAHQTAALERAESALKETLRAAKDANTRAARATSPRERMIHDETLTELMAEAEVLTARVDGLRAEATRIADMEAKIPKMREHRNALSAALAAGDAEQRKRAVSSAVESVRVDFASHQVEVRVRTI